MIAVSAAVIFSTAFGAAWAAGDYGPLQVVDSSAGKVLADEKGMTLYTYDKDTKGKSNCSGECAEYWPPAKASADAKPTGDLTLIKRDDGTMSTNLPRAWFAVSGARPHARSYRRSGGAGGGSGVASELGALCPRSAL